MSVPDDWRLTGQERYLAGVKLRRAKWNAPRPEWDHDHCDFCWARFMSDPLPGVLQEGYTTEDGHHWICPTCFNDFREHFGWQIEAG